ncbi:MAG: carbamoyltransferase HypF [Phycisphaerae bacterium]
MRTDKRILAMGADTKSRACVCDGSGWRLGPECGALSDVENYRRYRAAISALESAVGHWDLVAHDLHPQWLTTALAQSLGSPTLAVQHHHAHVAAVAAEHGDLLPIVGIACDGVGYGSDGASWGCEFLVVEGGQFERLGHLSYFALLGGDAAAIETWRPALALTVGTFGDQWRRRAGHLFARVPANDLACAETMLSRTVQSPATSSLGRVFDGASYLLGLCERNTHEAEAAAALESAAGSGAAPPYPYHTLLHGRTFEVSLSPAIEALVEDVGAGGTIESVAARWHETLAHMLADGAGMTCDMAGLRRVALAGGCFVNARLLSRTRALLEERRLSVVLPVRQPFGDAGLALGQAAVAAAHAASRPKGAAR